MTRWMPLGRSQAGVDWAMRDDGETSQFVAQADTTAHLEQNKAMALHNDGYSPDRTFCRVASIPPIVILKWKEEHGVDIYNPDHLPKVKQLLNSNEYLYLRTAEGRF